MEGAPTPVVVDEPGDHHDLSDLPPGFRFHPTDEEIITHYLMDKVTKTTFSAKAIGEVDLNKCEPWDLPEKAKMGEKEWYFFCQRDRKYPTGMRTNRATESGYWKATGKDKEIYKGRGCLVGMKKTLVFYKGRAPKGEKSNWVMHEFRLEGKFSYYNFPKAAKPTFSSLFEWLSSSCECISQEEWVPNYSNIHYAQFANFPPSYQSSPVPNSFPGLVGEQAYLRSAIAAARSDLHQQKGTTALQCRAEGLRQCKVEQQFSSSTNQSAAQQVSLSQDTGLSNDITTTAEISSSMVSKQDMNLIGGRGNMISRSNNYDLREELDQGPLPELSTLKMPESKLHANLRELQIKPCDVCSTD
ncbi:hypothetical protein RJ639_022898 [Escallonia herrerae]|uniref:NAC domain-containing protein n=1 Tax=Escallonia herrerae TaxID=1293975 RepID=A0AA88UZG5_9ASTE|nr:hypothetical protein RJ639_022898 [Escallonia herrerae]